MVVDQSVDRKPEAVMHLYAISIASSLAAATAITLFAGLQPSARALPAGGDLGEEVQALSQGALLDDAVRGLSIVVEIGGETLVSQGTGIAGCDPERADEHTRYAAGGCLDLFLAIAGMRMAERDELDLDAEVSSLIEGFPFADEDITVGQLFAHTSGLPSLSDLPDAHTRSAAAQEDIASALMERMGDLPLTAEPGSCQSYSSGGVLALGLLLKTVSGREVQDLIRAEVVEPFDLEDTGFFEPNETPFQRFMGAQQSSSSPQPLPFNAEALRTTAADLAQLGTSLLSAEFEGLLDRLRSPVNVQGKPAAFAHGLVLGDLQEHDYFSFGGSSDSCAIQCAVYPDLELTIAICASTGEAPIERLERSIARLVYGLAEPGLQDLALPAGAEKTYGGEFLVGCNSYWFTVNGPRLRVSLPEAGSFDLLYQGEHVFVSTVDSGVRFLFEVIDGIAPQFILEEHGAQAVGKRLQ